MQAHRIGRPGGEPGNGVGEGRNPSAGLIDRSRGRHGRVGGRNGGAAAGFVAGIEILVCDKRRHRGASAGIDFEDIGQRLSQSTRSQDFNARDFWIVRGTLREADGNLPESVDRRRELLDNSFVLTAGSCINIEIA
ncbi:MAG: hypothetical protein ABSG47_19465 [Terracidiphilus sp.]